MGGSTEPKLCGDLGEMPPQDAVERSVADHRTPVPDGLTASRVVRYPKDRFPSAAVYGAINYAGLRLITCGGDFDQRTGHYVDNIVVYAALRMAHPPDPAAPR